jgi:uncharacterized protein (TIGR02271 family)
MLAYGEGHKTILRGDMIMKTVVGLFDSYAQAERAEQDLENAGISRDDISLIASNENQQFGPNPATTTTGDMGRAAGTGASWGAGIGGVLGLLAGAGLFAIPGVGWVAGAGWLAGLIGGAVVGGIAGGLIGALTQVGVPQEDAAYYSEGVRRGGVLLTVRAQDDAANRVAQIMNDDGAINIDERAAQWRQEGFLPSPATPMSTAANTAATATQATAANWQQNRAQTAPPANTQNLNAQGETVLPVVEEELAVGKRQVERGGVRVYTHVTEQPVQEQVTLHEEHVNVERRPADRPVSDADMAAFKEGTIEVTEMAEEPIVQKQARVVEEVVVNKEATDRTQTIQDTVRRTDVEVEQLAGSEHVSRNTMTFNDFADDFRNNWQTNYASQGGTYEQYEPAYRYGYDLANNPQYRGQNWTAIEPNIQRDWETRYPNTWNRMQNSVRYGWDKATGAERGGIKTGGYHTDDGTPDQRGIMEKIADTVSGDRIDDKTGKPV